MTADPGEDRLPLPRPDELTDEQRAAVNEISAGPRGSLFGPFVPLLQSPELMTRLQLVGEYIRFDSVLDDDLVELVILSVARHWDQQFEWGFHHGVALAKGLPADVIDCVAESRRPESGRPEVGLVWDLVDEIQQTGAVTDAVYTAASDALGPQRVVEAVATVGYYTTLAMVLNVARTPPPPGTPRLATGRAGTAT